jgi:hypothetical protein
LYTRNSSSGGTWPVVIRSTAPLNFELDVPLPRDQARVDWRVVTGGRLSCVGFIVATQLPQRRDQTTHALESQAQESHSQAIDTVFKTECGDIQLPVDAT